MKYILVHLIRGEAKAAHEAITADLADKFDSAPLHETRPPHLTLKRPFDSDVVDLEAVYEQVEKFAATQTQSDFSLSGYGKFGDDVIYVDVKATDGVYETTKALLEAVKDVPGMLFEEFDTGGDLHATVALQRMRPFDFDEVWEYLHSKEIPEFNLKFDNITVMKKIGEVWEVDRIFEIPV